MRLIKPLVLFRPYKARKCSRIGSLYKLENLNHSKMPDLQVFVNPKNEVTYPASCHCGKSRFTITIPSLDTTTVTSCNCSICQINGYLNVYPLRKNVSFQSPYEELGSYAFASQTLVHKFCRTCGTSLLIDFGRAEEEGVREHYAVNVQKSHPNHVIGRNANSKHAGSDVKGCGRVQTEDRALRRKALVVIAPCRMLSSHSYKIFPTPCFATNFHILET